MSFHIRAFAAEDYAAVVAVHNAVYPEYPIALDELRQEDERRDPKCRFQRWVAERDGQVVGVGHHDQRASRYHPRKFVLDITILPDHQGQGIGTALYQRISVALPPFDPLTLHARTQETMTRGLAFLRRRGFSEEARVWESRLDLATFDPRPYSGLEDGLRARGLTITTFPALATDPERDRKLYDLRNELDLDVPDSAPPTPLDFDRFAASRLYHPRLLREAFVIAVHHGDYVGFTSLWTNQASRDLHTGLTGVRRAYRRQGIALAIKARAITDAQAQGYPRIKTWNETGNAGMLAINQRLGFVRQPAWIHLVMSWPEGGPDTTTTIHG